MGVLKKKIIASSLTEVLIATVLIVLVIGIAFTTLSNVLQNSATKQTQQIENTLSELQYLYKNRKIKLPFHTKTAHWNIQIYKKTNLIFFEAENTTTKKIILKKTTPNGTE